MNHYLVLGAGKMGVVLAKDLLESDVQCEVTLVDIDSAALRNAGEFIQDDRLVMLQRDIDDQNQRDESCNQVHAQNFNMAQIRRAVIVLGTILGVCLGL